MMKKKNDTSRKAESPSRLIDARIKGLGDWRGEVRSRASRIPWLPTPRILECGHCPKVKMDRRATRAPGQTAVPTPPGAGMALMLTSPVSP
jgi:hypothetical protein